MAARRLVYFEYAVFVCLTLFHIISSDTTTTTTTTQCKFDDLSKTKTDPCFKPDPDSVQFDPCKAVKDLSDIICKDEQLRIVSYDTTELIHKSKAAFCNDVKEIVKDNDDAPELMKEDGWCKYFCYTSKDTKIICFQVYIGTKILKDKKVDKPKTNVENTQELPPEDDKAKVNANPTEKEGGGNDKSTSVVIPDNSAADNSKPSPQSAKIDDKKTTEKLDTKTPPAKEIVDPQDKHVTQSNKDGKGNEETKTNPTEDKETKTEEKPTTQGEVTESDVNKKTILPKLSEEKGEKDGKDKSIKPDEGENESGETTDNVKLQEKLEEETNPTDELPPDSNPSDQSEPELTAPVKPDDNGAPPETNDDDVDEVSGKDKEKSVAILPGSGLPTYTESNFFVYFISAVVLCIILYLGFHNKQKIIALIIEGRQERRRRSNVNYKKLDSNLDEVLHGAGGKGTSMTPAHIIY